MSRLTPPRRHLVATLVATLAAAGVLSCQRAPTPPGDPIPREVARLATFIGNDASRDLTVAPAAVEGADPPPRLHQIRLGRGWRPPGPQGAWAVGEHSTLELHLPRRTDLTLRFEAQAYDVEAVDVIVNGVPASTVGLTPEWALHEVAVSAGHLRVGRNEVTLAFARREPSPGGDALAAARRFTLGLLETRSPSQAGLAALLPRIRQRYPDATVVSGDRLNLPGLLVADLIPGNGETATRWQWNATLGSLSARFRRVEIRPDLASAPEPPLVPTEMGWSVRASGTVVIPFGVDRRATSVRLAAELSGPAGEARVVPTLRVVSGEPVRGAATALGRGDRAGWELSLGADGGVGCLRLDVDLGEMEGTAELGLSVATTPASPVRSAPAVSPVPGPRPDIVLIVLDAARADHVGAYGYHRDTTPHLDRLAAESFVFETAFATAPYTLASMPTMLTGLSLVDHGVIAHGLALSDEATTLAEALRGVGYRTTCLSANPNSSIRVGLDQGCEVFLELWHDVEPAAAVDPHRLVALALARWSARGADPAFMMLHLVPPHDPYRPTPEFDVFGDEAYDGGYDGSLDTLQAVDRRVRKPQPEDVAEIVSLYDGNLRMADDAVGQVLDALRASPRWDETVVLVVSDHGEAFGEHGRFLHNSTLYDEMLAVPFMLRVPPGRRPARVETASLVSLADVVPTLLSLAGVAPPAPLPGRDLLDGDQRPASGILARAASRPLFAFRTSRRKLIWSADGRAELYDLAVDPGETDDVALERFGEVQCLAALAGWELGQPRSLAPRDGSALSDDDERALRALGYIR